VKAVGKQSERLTYHFNSLQTDEGPRAAKRIEEQEFAGLRRQILSHRSRKSYICNCKYLTDTIQVQGLPQKPQTLHSINWLNCVAET
jgi:hypothetical protein